MSIEAIHWDETLAAGFQGGAVSIGNFDGVHQGHVALLTELRHQAEMLGGPALVLTFDPHPLKLLKPERFLPVLTTTHDRAELLQANGADHVLILQTTPAFLQLSASDFFEQMLVKRLRCRAVVEGRDFGFGRNREGNVETLASMCQSASMQLTIVPPLQRDGAPISSSRVRSALVSGDVREASNLLGRPYRLRGRVGHGQRRGQTIGFPTANLEGIISVVPADGVYAVLAHREGQSWPAAVNVGPNPTFGEDARKVEVHLIGFHGELYGEPLAVDFVEHLRETRKFAGVEALVRQLRLDIEQATQLLGQRHNR